MRTLTWFGFPFYLVLPRFTQVFIVSCYLQVFEWTYLFQVFRNFGVCAAHAIVFGQRAEPAVAPAAVGVVAGRAGRQRRLRRVVGRRFRRRLRRRHPRPRRQRAVAAAPAEDAHRQRRHGRRRRRDAARFRGGRLLLSAAHVVLPTGASFPRRLTSTVKELTRIRSRTG